MDQTNLDVLSSSKNRPLLVRLGTYLLHEEADNTRIKLYQAILFSVLHNEKKPASPIEIKAKMKAMLGVEPDISILNDIAKNLVLNKRLKYHDNKLLLPENVKEYLDSLILKHSDLEKSFVTSYSVVTNLSYNQAKRKFYNQMAEVFTSLGSNAIMFLTGDADQGSRLIPDNNFLYMLKKIIGENEMYVDFIYPLASSYVAVYLLNLDPDCQKISKGLLNERTIYLDTNMLLSFIANVEEMHELIKIMGGDIRGNLKVLSTTVDEYKHLCEHWKESIAVIQSIDRIKRYSDIIDDEVIKFWKISQGFTSISLSDYLTMISRVDIYLERLNIEIDEISIEELAVEKLIDEWYNFEDIIKIIKMYSIRKTDRTAFHDAFAITKVQELRRESPGDIIGPQVWFLTRDNSLRKVEEELRFPIQSSVFLPELISIFSIFTSPKSDYNSGKDLFLSLLSSSLPPFTIGIDLNKFLLLEGSWMDDPVLQPEDMCMIFGEERVKKILEESKKSGEPISSREISIAISPLVLEIKSLRKHSEEEFTGLKEKIEISELEKSNLKNEINDIKKSLESDKEVLTKRVSDLETEKKQEEEETERKVALYHFTIWILLLAVIIILGYTYFTTDLIPLTSIPVIYVILTFIISQILGYDPKKRFKALFKEKKRMKYPSYYHNNILFLDMFIILIIKINVNVVKPAIYK